MITVEKRGGENGETAAVFRCKSTEVSNLPTDSSVPANSSCFLIDTQKLVFFDADTKTWI